MINIRKSLGAFAMLGLMMLVSCSKEGQEPTPPSSSIRRIDIAEIVPIHESSMEFFDYVFTYSDNNGLVQVDTIKGASSLNYSFYANTYSYTICPVLCKATVELVPTVPETEVASFTFITPKPFLTATIHYSSYVGPDGSDKTLPEGYEEILISSMKIGDFLSTYGKIFTSYYQVIDEDESGTQVISC